MNARPAAYYGQFNAYEQKVNNDKENSLKAIAEIYDLHFFYSERFDLRPSPGRTVIYQLISLGKEKILLYGILYILKVDAP